MVRKILIISGAALLSVILLLCVGTAILYASKSPSHDRVWELGQQVLQRVELTGDRVTVHDLRDYDWTAVGREEHYEDVTFSIEDITGIEVGVSSFSAREEIAHVFVTFTVDGGDDIGLSIEARRDGGEGFGFVKGLLWEYELMYILATKDDLLSLREKRDEEIRVYPVRTSPEKAQQAFLLLATRVNEIYAMPELYHPILRNCTNQIVAEIEKISEQSFPFYEKTFAPGFSGRVLYDLGLIATDATSYEQAEEEFLITF